MLFLQPRKAYCTTYNSEESNLQYHIQCLGCYLLREHCASTSAKPQWKLFPKHCIAGKQTASFKLMNFKTTFSSLLDKIWVKRLL